MEFAVVAPVFVLLIFGLIEFSRMMMLRQALTNAAREGCRNGILATTTTAQSVDSMIRSRLQGIVASPTDTNKVRVTVTPASFASITHSTLVSAEVEVSYSDVSWFPPWFLGNVKIKGQASMKRE